jgi:hypothetical protein
VSIGTTRLTSLSHSIININQINYLLHLLSITLLTLPSQTLYVDDLFLTGEEKLITDCKKKLATEFEMKDLGLMHYFLGLEVWQSPEKIFLNQGKYAVEILKRFDMLECKAMNTPMETKLKLLVDTSSELVDATCTDRSLDR